MTQAAPSGSAFWRFSLGFYRQGGVAEACIRLQDEKKVDVNLLLFLLWQAALGRALSEHDVEDLERRVAPWRNATVIPLRTVRRALKPAPGLVSAPAAHLFRTRIKAVELEAERLQQEAMDELARNCPYGRKASSTDEAARVNLASYAMICRTSFPEPEIATLLAALGSPELKWRNEHG
jgi:uncharacterized protein (TIGR02444 family)